jgi:hypothetical protein
MKDEKDKRTKSRSQTATKEEVPIGLGAAKQEQYGNTKAPIQHITTTFQKRKQKAEGREKTKEQSGTTNGKRVVQSQNNNQNLQTKKKTMRRRKRNRRERKRKATMKNFPIDRKSFHPTYYYYDRRRRGRRRPRGRAR